jgi:hypothetical protein
MGEWRRADLVDAMGEQATDVYVRSLTITREQGTRLADAIEAEFRDEEDHTAATQRIRKEAAGKLPVDTREFERDVRNRLVGLRIPSRIAADCGAEITSALLGYALFHAKAITEEDRDAVTSIWQQVIGRRP